MRVGRFQGAQIIERAPPNELKEKPQHQPPPGVALEKIAQTSPLEAKLDAKSQFFFRQLAPELRHTLNTMLADHLEDPASIAKLKSMLASTLFEPKGRLNVEQCAWLFRAGLFDRDPGPFPMKLDDERDVVKGIRVLYATIDLTSKDATREAAYRKLEDAVGKALAPKPLEQGLSPSRFRTISLIWRIAEDIRNHPDVGPRLRAWVRESVKPQIHLTALNERLKDAKTEAEVAVIWREYLDLDAAERTYNGRTADPWQRAMDAHNPPKMPNGTLDPKILFPEMPPNGRFVDDVRRRFKSFSSLYASARSLMEQGRFDLASALLVARRIPGAEQQSKLCEIIGVEPGALKPRPSAPRRNLEAIVESGTKLISRELEAAIAALRKANAALASGPKPPSRAAEASKEHALRSARKVMERFRAELLERSEISPEDAMKLAGVTQLNDEVRRCYTSEAVIAPIAEAIRWTNGRGVTSMRRLDAKDDRAFASRGQQMIDLSHTKYSDDALREVAFHEWGHHYEYNDTEANDAALAWRESRKIADGLETARGENYMKCDVIDRYVARVYPKMSSDGKEFTEVLSMGLQYFRSADAMIELMEKSPSHFQLMLGLLRG